MVARDHSMRSFGPADELLLLPAEELVAALAFVVEVAVVVAEELELLLPLLYILSARRRSFMAEFEGVGWLLVQR